MSLFQFKWIRKLIRRNTKPIPYKTAFSWKERLSIAYMLLAWNAFGMIGYMFYTGRGDWAKYYGYKSEEESMMSPAQYFAKQMNIDKARVVTISGFRKKHDYEYEPGVEENVPPAKE